MASTGNDSELQIMKFSWSQFDADPDRPKDQGSSACVHIVEKCISGIMNNTLTQDTLFDEQSMRAITVDAVRACDAQRHTDGVHTLAFLQERIGSPRLSLVEEIVCEKWRLALALCRDLPPAAIAITTQKLVHDIAGEPTGNTMVTFFDGRAFAGFDPHGAISWRIVGTGVREAKS